MTAVVVALGGKAAYTQRGSSLKQFIRTGSRWALSTIFVMIQYIQLLYSVSNVILKTICVRRHAYDLDLLDYGMMVHESSVLVPLHIVVHCLFDLDRSNLMCT